VAKAEIKKKYKFVIYVCPQCNSNIAQYGNKISIISNRIIKTLVRHKKFKCCGELYYKKEEKPPITSPELTPDTITDLKILLETSKDVDSFLKNI
jgi:hypothetical protein